MSNAIICDECGRILKSSDALHCYEVLTKEGGTVYGADICKDCLPQFDRKADIHGWNLSYKKRTERQGKFGVEKKLKFFTFRPLHQYEKYGIIYGVDREQVKITPSGAKER